MMMMSMSTSEIVRSHSYFLRRLRWLVRVQQHLRASGPDLPVQRSSPLLDLKKVTSVCWRVHHSKSKGATTANQLQHYAFVSLSRKPRPHTMEWMNLSLHSARMLNRCLHNRFCQHLQLPHYTLRRLQSSISRAYKSAEVYATGLGPSCCT